jgi:group I intron endonuclease
MNQNMYYFVYQTKNLSNNKIYVGVHSTANLNDGYLGSGKLLKRAITKYGPENFERVILKEYDSKEEAFQYEKEIVNQEFVNREDVYNIKLGGRGGWDHINSNDSLLEQIWKRRTGYMNGMFGRTHSEKSREQISQNKIGKKLGKQKPDHITKKAQSKCLSYKLTSPSGEEFITKNLKSFCDEHNLAYKTMSKIPVTNRQPTSGACVGWRIVKQSD